MQIPVSFVFATLAKVLINLLPLLGLFIFGWSIFSVLLLFWFESLLLVFVGLFYFFFVMRFGKPKPKIGTVAKNLILKLIFASFVSIFLLLVIILQAWAVYLSFVELDKKFDHSLPEVSNIIGQINFAFHIMIGAYSFNFIEESTFLLALFITTIDDFFVFFHLSKDLIQVDIMRHYWDSFITVFILAILNWWMLMDSSNPDAINWTYRITVLFIFLKLGYELRPYLKSKA